MSSKLNTNRYVLCVFIVWSKRSSVIYVGYTDNLKIRIEKHNNGYVKSTKHRRPLRLIYYEAYFKESDAKKREKYLKGGNGRNDLKIQLKNILEELNYKNL